MDIRKLGLGLGAFAAGAAVWTFGADRYGGTATRLLRKLRDRTGSATGESASGGRAHTSGNEHVPIDLLGDATVGDARAPEAFRPDPTAIPTDEERQALRPATGPAPTIVADRGSGFAEAAGGA